MALVYRNPQAQWTSYDKVLLEPVTLWRSGRKSLEAVPEGDLLRLIADLEGAVRRRLGDGFELVDAPGAGVMQIPSRDHRGAERTCSSIATNLISLYKALGGGWEMRQGQPFVPDSMRIEMHERTNWGNYFSKPPTVKAEGGTFNPR